MVVVVFVFFLAVEAFVHAAADWLTANLHASSGPVAWTLCSTNLLFFGFWMLVMGAVVRFRRLTLPWVKSAPGVYARWALAFASLILAFLYAEAAWRWAHANLHTPRPEFFLETMLLAPLMEEALFRGILWEELTRALSGVRRNVALGVTMSVTSFAFSAWHLPFRDHQLVAHVFFGFAMAFVRMGTGRLAPCIACHAVANVMTSFAF